MDVAMLDFAMINGLAEVFCRLVYASVLTKISKDWLLGHLDDNGTYLADCLDRLPNSIRIWKMETESDSNKLKPLNTYELLRYFVYPLRSGTDKLRFS